MLLTAVGCAEPPAKHLQPVVAEEYFTVPYETRNAEDAIGVGAAGSFSQILECVRRLRLSKYFCPFRSMGKALCEDIRIANVALLLPQGIEGRVSEYLVILDTK